MNTFRKSSLWAKSLATASIGALLAAGLAMPAAAQITDEIVVTATKRAQNLQEVGLSVTAYTGDALREFSLENSVDLAGQTPGLNVGTPVGEGNNPSFTLRGVGLNDFNDNNEGPIAIYTDEVYNAFLAGLTFQLFDTERVEILRGPQGTLYGRNATGGLLHFISNKPSETFEAYARGTYGSYNSLELEGAVSGPISDGMRFRLAAKRSKADGYVTNRIGPDSNEADSIALRAMLDFDLSEKGSFLLTGEYSNADTRAPYYQHAASDGVADVFGYRDTDNDVFAGDYSRDGDLRIKVKGVSGVLNWDFGNVQLTNITSYKDLVKFHEEDTDVGPISGLEPTFQADSKQFSNEFRLSGETDKMNWVAGAYYIDTEVVGQLDLNINYLAGFAQFLDSDPNIFGGLLSAFTPSLLTAAPGDLLPFAVFDVDYVQNTKSVSIFGNVDYELSDALTVVAGLRYTDESRDMEYLAQMPTGSLLNDAFLGLGFVNYFDFRTGALNAGNGAGAVGDLNKIDDENVSGTIGLNYTTDAGTLLYAKIAQGFKSGGFNAGFLDASDGIQTTQVPYNAAKLTSYEAGVKWASPGGKVRANLSGFYYDYKDFQALTFQGLSQAITNSDAQFIGAEIEVGATLSEGLTAQLGASFLDASVDQVVSQGVVLTDVTPVLAPEFTANGFIRYERPLGFGTGSAMVSFNHQGAHYFDITNTDASKENAYTIVDARLAMATEDDKYEFSVFAKNLFQEEYRVYSFDFAGPAGLLQNFYGRPRWFGASISAKWGG